MTNFEPLEEKLDIWFDKPLNTLPYPLRHVAIAGLSPFTWDELSTEQRRSVVIQYDYLNDPASQEHREYWFNFHTKKDELEDRLAKWKATSAPTAIDLEHQEQHIRQLTQELTHLTRLHELLTRRHFPRYSKTSGKKPILSKPKVLIELPKVLQLLNSRLGASMAEIAAWVVLGENSGGVRAFKQQSDPKNLNRFYFEAEMDHDYLVPLLNCEFDEKEVCEFEPKERFISGESCLEVLRNLVDQPADVFLMEMIRGGKITDLHPVTGATRAASPEDTGLPPIETGLFSINELEKLLVEFGIVQTGSLSIDSISRARETPEQRKSRLISWHKAELATGKPGALNRTAERAGIKRQTLSAILNR